MSWFFKLAPNLLMDRGINHYKPQSTEQKEHYSNTSVSLLSSADDFSSIGSDWDALLSHNEIDSVFLSHGWLKCFWNVWGNDKQLSVLYAHQGSHLVGTAPLMRYNGKHLGLPARMLSFIENDESPHCGFVIDQETETETIVRSFLSHITSNTDSWDILLLRKIPAESGIIDCIKIYCKKNGYKFIVRPSLNSPVLHIDSDWASFYLQKSQRFKKRIRHAVNRLKKQGDITIQETHSSEELEPLIWKIFEVGARSWKGNIDKAIGSTPQNRSFFSKLPYYITPKGAVSLWSLFINNRIIAFEYHIKQEDVVYALRGEFDEDYRNCSPGSVLDFEVIRSFFKNNMRLYNMGGGMDEYKLRWTHLYQSHFDILLFNNKPYSAFLAFLEKNIKPAIYRLFRKNSHHPLSH